MITLNDLVAAQETRNGYAVGIAYIVAAGAKPTQEIVDRFLEADETVLRMLVEASA